MLQKNKLNTLVWILAIAINGLIVVSFFSPKATSLQRYGTAILPLINAILNGATFLALLTAFIAIKRKNILLHRRFIMLAFSFTFLFLLSYLLYHFSTPSTKYRGPDMLRYIYLFILLTHIILAIVIVPLATFTMSLAIKGEVVRHRKIAKWAMPVWLYVSFTGVVVYLLIAPYYPHH